MVSIQCDIIKFLLIYRHLQNAYWFKRETHAVSDGGSDKAQYRNLHELTP